MNRYKAYPEYEKSKLQWADRTPKHWNSVHLRWIAKLYAGGTPSKAIEEYWENGSVPWINSGEVNQGLISEVSTYITEAAYKNSSAKWIPKNALVMALAGQGKTKGMIAQLAIDATCNQSMAAIVSQDLQSSRYLFWWLHSNYQNIRNMAGGDLRDGLNLELLGDIGCPIPNVEEQLSIAAFLDHETAKIDALIEKQQWLIELLKEKRQAVISHAVTKGLNPNAPMKDSGVEWLGEVPAHWGMTKFHYKIDLLEGPGILANDFHDEGVPLLRIQNVKDKFVSRDYKTYLSPSKVRAKWEHFRVAQGDLIISCSATTGLVSEVGEDTVGAVPYTGLIRLRPQVKASITKEFIRCLVQSDLFFEQIKLLQSGSTIQHFGPYHLQQMHITLPALTEQNEIAKAVKEKTARLDKLISIADQQIELMQERRTALISAAVTGKIDVRDWQAAA
ncbi:restriction endonuclease subunit S [Comamonas antarctica]|uniref:Restriction endonuclease subunit S n=1 Tax=Comamonas antarctica TaxID=2743470 RepID=A0A6N1X895_9BURK|nr:restriction endonuclease subunit S [Comamonas antarctica]QKV55587.1 restriction endonuclease subunit S [Comamonas antarctica]